MNILTQIFTELVGASWRVAGLMLVLAGLRFFVRRYVPASGLFAAWLILIVALLVPGRLPVAWPSFEVLKPAKPAPASMAVGVEAESAIAEEGNVVQAARIPAVAGGDVRSRSRVDFHVFDTGVTMPREWVSNLALIWLAGTVALLGLRLGLVVQLRRKLAKTSIAADSVLVDAVTQGCVEIGIKRSPVVLTTPLVASPALCGLMRPRLLFPPGFAQRLGAGELRFVVLHELGHLRRRDLWAQTLLHVAATVHWFNPVVWLAVRMARLDCELACDEFVLRREPAEQNDGYGRTLLKVLGTVRGENRLPITLGIVEGKRQLLTRITVISDYRPRTLRRTLGGVGLLTAFTVVGYTEEAKPTAAGLPVPAGPRVTEASPIQTDPITITSDTTAAPPLRADAVITLIASNPVRVKVSAVPDQKVLFEGTLTSGQRQSVQRNSAVYITATSGENLEVEVAGKRLGVGFKGYNRGKLPWSGDVPGASEAESSEWAGGKKIVLRAIGAPGGVPVAVFDVGGEPKLVIEGSGLVTARVTEIDGANGRVTVSVGKVDSREFKLTNPRPVKFPEITPKQYDLIVTGSAKRSRDDERVPSELVFAWSAINAEGKEAILMNYLRRGLVININGTPGGAGVITTRLFEKKIAQRVAERREAFVASLTPEQRERFRGGGQMAIKFTAPPEEREKMAALSQVNKAQQDRVIAELTPDQRQLYDLWRAAMEL